MKTSKSTIRRCVVPLGLIAIIGLALSFGPTAEATVTLTGNARFVNNVFADSTSSVSSPGGGTLGALWDGNVATRAITTLTSGLNDTRSFQVNWASGVTLGTVFVYGVGQSTPPNWQAGNLQHAVSGGGYQSTGTADWSTGQEIFNYRLGNGAVPQSNVTSLQINITAPIYFSGGGATPYYGQLNELVGLPYVRQRIAPTGFGQSSSINGNTADKLYDSRGANAVYGAQAGWYSAAPGTDPNPWAYNTWLGTPKLLTDLLLNTGDQDSGTYQPNKYSIYTLKLGGDPTQLGDWNWQFSVDQIPATSQQVQLLSLPTPVMTEGVKAYIDSPRSGGAAFAELILLTTVPEPSTSMLLGLGGLFVWRRVRRNRK